MSKKILMGKGYNLYIKESEEKEYITREWESVEDKKPKKNQRVIGYNRAHHTFFIGKYIFSKKHCIGIKTDVEKINEFDNPKDIYAWVTHWKPFEL